MTAILCYEVPVDDAWHTITFSGPIVHVGMYTPEFFEFWAHTGGPQVERVFRVFNTGETLPEPDAHTRPVYVGTASCPDVTWPTGYLPPPSWPLAAGPATRRIQTLHLFELEHVDGWPTGRQAMHLGDPEQAGVSTSDVTRRFVLHRDTDVSGISGTGVVAEGIVFTDGTVGLRWRSAWPTSVVFHDRGIEAVREVHGHGGATRIVWLDPES